MLSLETASSVFTDRMSSFSFRLIDWSWVRNAFLTYCWVMVEPPCVEPPCTLFSRALVMPTGENPVWLVKSLSSAAMTASRACSGTCSRGIEVRVMSPTWAIIVPSL